MIDGPLELAKSMAYEFRDREYKQRLTVYETKNKNEHSRSIYLEREAQLFITTFEWDGDVNEFKYGCSDLKYWQMACVLED